MMNYLKIKQSQKDLSSAKRQMVLLTSVLALFLMAISGCKKFLDVQPQDKVPQDKLFNDEQGFKDALTGIYLSMDKAPTIPSLGLYTNDLTMGMMSALAYDYDNATTANAGGNGTFYNNIVNYYYTDLAVKAEMDGIWNTMYNNIANLNNIVSQIDSRKDIFSGDNFERIKGEVLALRALFHFDLARIYGQPPLTGMDAPAIPYVNKFTVTPTRFSSLRNVLDSCIADLHAATALLEKTDTSAVLKAVDDPFTAYTQNHMNYWATQALMARVYLYKG